MIYSSRATFPNILRLSHCLIYCLFWGLKRVYSVDFIDWIDSRLGM